MKTLYKIIPYMVVILLTVFVTRFIDKTSATSQTVEEKKELMLKVEGWRNKYHKAQSARNMLKKENEILLQEIEQYEIENDTVVSLIRDANDKRDFTRLDSLGDDLINRL